MGMIISKRFRKIDHLKGKRLKMFVSERTFATIVHVAPRPPPGVSSPNIQPNITTPLYGFVENAERINSRAAMIAFIFVILFEAIANKGLLELIGIQVGKGISLDI